MTIFLFLTLILTKSTTSVTPVVSNSMSSDTLREGTYHWIGGSRCCEPLITTLRIKRYTSNRYYIVTNYFDTLNIPQSCDVSCSGLFTVNWRAGKTIILQKTESVQEVDSLQIQQVGDMILFRQFSKKSKINLNQQFKYVSKIEYSLFDMDFYHAYFYEPKFSKPVKIKCYEYPDEILKPRLIKFHSIKDWVVKRCMINDVENANKGFYFIYFDFIESDDPCDTGLEFESFKHHLWIRKKDFLKYFRQVRY